MSKPRNLGHIKDLGEGFSKITDGYCNSHGWQSFFEEVCQKCNWETKPKPRVREGVYDEE